jgi:hypothetical protein
MLKLFFVLVTLICFTCCDQKFNAPDVVGVYVGQGHINNFDILVLKRNGVYHI